MQELQVSANLMYVKVSWFGFANPCIDYRFPKAQERLHELQRSGSKASRPVNGKLSRKDQKKDEENCVLM